MRRRLFLGALAASFALGVPAGAEEERRLIVPDLPGADAGATARILQPYLERALAAPLTVDFRPGAGGIVGLTAGARSPADGSVLTLLTQAVTLAPWLSRRMDCAPADFYPLARVSFAPAALVVAVGSPWRAVRDVLAGKRGGKRIVAPAPSDWAPAQIAQALFLSRAGLAAQFLSAPQTDAERIGAVASGEADLAFVTLKAAKAAADRGVVRILATSSGMRETEWQSVPTLVEAGLPVAIGAWRTLAVPAAVPVPVLDHLSGAARRVVEEAGPELRAAGLSPAWLGPAEMRRAMEDEYREAGRLFASLGLSVRRQASM